VSRAASVRATFLGAPGSGKGTQAQRLASESSFLHLSTGDLLRKEVAENSQLGKAAKQYLDSGRLVPDEVVSAMVVARLGIESKGPGWILDGFPRTLAQARSLDQALGRQAGSLTTGLSHAICFRVPEDVLVRRLTSRWTCSRCGTIWNTLFKPPKVAGVCDKCAGTLQQRSDDNPDAVRKRLEVYRLETEPVLGHYRGQGILREIDADRDPDAVFQTLKETLN
jgi:adenylate kinase